MSKDWRASLPEGDGLLQVTISYMISSFSRTGLVIYFVCSPNNVTEYSFGGLYITSEPS
jgi:hypothetical protein